MCDPIEKEIIFEKIMPQFFLGSYAWLREPAWFIGSALKYAYEARLATLGGPSLKIP